MIGVFSLDKLLNFDIANAKFDVEAPKEWSTPTPVYIYPRRLLRKTFSFEQRLELPIHLRYHRSCNRSTSDTLYTFLVNVLIKPLDFVFVESIKPDFQRVFQRSLLFKNHFFFVDQSFRTF